MQVLGEKGDRWIIDNGKEKLAVSPQNLVPRSPWEACWRDECCLGNPGEGRGFKKHRRDRIPSKAASRLSPNET